MWSVGQVLAKSGYGFYIWPAYGLTFFILLVLIVASIRTLRARQNELSLMESQAPHRRRRARDRAAREGADDDA